MRMCVILGSSIMFLLGFVHLVLTLQSDPSGGPMTPIDGQTQRAMTREGGLGLAPHANTTLWRAWVGFNLSHSLGVIVVALIVLVPAWADLDGAVNDPLWLVAALALPVVYLVLSVRYWFAKPTIGITTGGVLIWTGVIGSLVA